MNTKKMICLAEAFGLAASVLATTPEVTNVNMVQPPRTRRVTITYTLSAQAVVTLDVQTNCVVNGETKWASIGGEALWNTEGDVWKKVDAGSRTISWRPDKSPWAGHVIAAGGARAVVTAWALDNTPDYMVVDIREGAEPNTQRYYPAADYLPGGLLVNEDYRRYSLVMRKIMAQGVTWTMGSLAEKSRNASFERMHMVTLTNDYYIGVFQFTQSQWACVDANRPAPANFQTDGAMRPVERVCYNELRLAAGSSDNSAFAVSSDVVRANSWPNPPPAGSFLGRLNVRTGLDFDLPSEAQWEYACRAGNGEGRYGDGSPILADGNDPNMNKLGRYRRSGGFLHTGSGNADADYTQPSSSVGPTNGTAVVGSYAPNSWGLYDMHGNLWEWCLDWRAEDISALNDGAPNISLTDATLPLTGTATARAARGGSWYQDWAYKCRSAQRWSKDPSARDIEYGFRVVCRAGLD